MEGPSPLPKQARYQKVPDGTLEDDSHPKKKKLPLHVVTNSKSYTDEGDNDDDDYSDHDDDVDGNDSSVSSRDRNDDDEQNEINSLVSPSKLNNNNESIFRSVTEDTVISRKRSGEQSLTGSHHHLMPTSRNNSSLLDDDELGDFASDWDDDEINLSRYNNAIYYSNNGNTTTTTMHSSNSSHNNNNPFQVVRDVPLPAEFDDSSIQQRCRRWWYIAQTHWNGMRYSARQRRAARLLSLPSETHRVYVSLLTVCCDATDIGIAVAAVSVILWIVLGGIARMGPTYWWLGLTLFMLRISARRCYNLASTWCLNTSAVRRVRRLRTNSDLHHHHHHPQQPHRHHPVANTDDMDLSPPPAWTMMTPISEQNTSTTTTTNNNSRRGRPHGDIGISLKRVDSPKATSPNPPTPTSV